MAVKGDPAMATDNKHRNNFFTAYLRAPDNGLVLFLAMIIQEALASPFNAGLAVW
jgi:hypothetical protein